jgi:hypothetical protein
VSGQIELAEDHRELFADTGGAPVPGAAYDGAHQSFGYGLGRSGLEHIGCAGHALYYLGNYPRLQQVKARWDPRNVFHHPMSVRADA